MKNQPNRIFLVIGEQADELDEIDFKNLREVSWSEEKIYEGDIEYINSKFLESLIKENKELEKLKRLLNER